MRQSNFIVYCFLTKDSFQHLVCRFFHLYHQQCLDSFYFVFIENKLKDFITSRIL